MKSDLTEVVIRIGRLTITLDLVVDRAVLYRPGSDAVTVSLPDLMAALRLARDRAPDTA